VIREQADFCHLNGRKALTALNHEVFKGLTKLFKANSNFASGSDFPKGHHPPDAHEHLVFIHYSYPAAPVGGKKSITYSGHVIPGPGSATAVGAVWPSDPGIPG
jgi:hypothetical protein